MLVSEIDGKIVMMNIETGTYHGLDEVATTIWTFLEDSADIKSICSHLQNKYDVDQKTCEEETVTFLQQMADKNMITIG
ncbi:MAG: hypothetical protein Roseis3KO_01610 [Roseivirga sp.]